MRKHTTLSERLTSDELVPTHRLGRRVEHLLSAFLLQRTKEAFSMGSLLKSSKAVPQGRILLHQSAVVEAHRQAKRVLVVICWHVCMLE